MKNAIQTFQRALLAVALALAPALTLASYQTDGPWPSFVKGKVYARALVLGPSGKPIWAEFDAQGQVTNVLGEAVGTYADAKTMPAAQYDMLVRAFREFVAEHEDGIARGYTVLDRATYEDPATTFTTFNGQAVNKPALLWSSTRSVVVRHRNALATPNTNPVLLESPIDLRDPRNVSASDKSVLLNPQGQVLYVSQYDLGYRAAYRVRGPDQPSECTTEVAYDPSEDLDRPRTGIYGYPGAREGDALCGPVMGSQISMYNWYAGDLYAYTDEAGKYFLPYYNLPCPGFDIEFTQHVIQKIFYSHFHPRARSTPRFRYQIAYQYEWCLGSHHLLQYSGNLVGLSAYMSIEAMIASMSTPKIDLNFPVDVTALTGSAPVNNQAVGGPAVTRGPTQYGVDLPGFEQTPPADWDFDSDGQADKVAPWEGAWGVWLNGKQPTDVDADGNPLPPDFTTVPHSNPDFQHQGLLKSLSRDDLMDTDLYVYRMSNGERVAEKRGLLDLEVDDAENRIYISLLLPSGRLTRETEQRLRNPFDDGLSYDESLLARDANFLRPGEAVKVIAINRKTGYIGSVVTTLTAPSNGYVDVPVDDLVLGPPNLTVRVERLYDVQAGLTAGEERQYLVGFEGSALTSDTYVAIYTEWYDQDNTPLPADLPGYTGRVAKTIADRTLDNGIAHFPIEPGKKIQVLALNGTDLVNEHFYIHVNGQAYDQGQPDFGGIGAGEGALQFRPQYYVPIKVPVFDEAETRRRKNALAQAQRDGQDVSTLTTDPSYRWVYRPEMQFSVYDLEVTSLTLQNSEGQEVSLVGDNALPVVGADDQFVKILYDLAGSAFTALDPLGGNVNRQLVFVVGEQEVIATIDQDQTVTLSNLGHLAELSPAEYLNIALYQNGDSANQLWQFAVALGIHGAPDTALIDADEGGLDLVAYLLTPRDAEDGADPRAVELSWEVIGAGATLESERTTSTIGVFNNRISVPREAGREYSVRVQVVHSTDPHVIRGDSLVLGPFKVVPGEPHRIEFDTQSTVLPADEVSTADFTAKVFDRNDNPVADGTPVTWHLDYDGELQDQESLTAEGTATATYLVGDKGLPTAVRLIAGSAEASFTVEKQLVDLNLTASQSTLPAGTVSTVTLTVATDAADGTPVEWNSTRGTFLRADAAVADGSAIAVLQAAPEPGEGIVSVAVAGAGQSLQIQHLPTSSGPITAEFEHAAIVAAASPGSVVIDGLYGPRSHNYINSTTAIIRGAPGTQLQVQVGGFFTPNATPAAHFAMNGLEAVYDPDAASLPDQSPQPIGYRVTDFVSGIVARSIGGLREDYDNAFTLPGSSLAFTGGYLGVDADPALDITDDLFVNVRFRAESTNGEQVLVRKGSGSETAYALVLDGNLVRASATTDSGVYSVTGTTEIQPDRWYLVGLRVRNGGLELGINAERARTAIAGSLIGQGAGIAIGYQFEGNIDDVKIGRDGPANALMTFDDGGRSGLVTIGADGAARIPVQATGAPTVHGQVVGLSVAIVTETGALEEQEVQFSNIALNMLTRMLGVKAAYADAAAGAQEGGVGLAKDTDWGYVAEWLGVRTFGQYWDSVKTVAEFVYSLTAISDVVVLLKAVISLAKGDLEGIDGYEVTFAAVSIGATLLAVFTTGGAALPAFKGGLIAIKPVLKELFATGARDALKVGVVVSKFMFKKIKDFVTGRTSPGRELILFASGLKRLVLDTSGLALRAFFHTVRSLEDLLQWVRRQDLDEICLIASVGSGAGVRYAAASPDWATTASALLFDGLFGRPAEAASCSGRSVNTKLDELAEDAGRFGSTTRAADIHRAVGKAVADLKAAGIELKSEKALDTLADIAHHGSPELLNQFVAKSISGWRSRGTFRRLYAQDMDRFIEVLGRVPAKAERYAEWVSVLKHDNWFGIKGIFGEALAVDRMFSKYPGLDPDTIKVSDRLNHEYIDQFGNTQKAGQLGIDMEGTLSDGRKLFMESKVRASSAGLDRAKVLDDLDRQLHKHLETKILTLVRTVNGRPRFDGGKIPILEYQLAGSFYQGIPKSEIFGRFKKILDEPRFNSLRAAGFRFDESNIEIMDDIAHPFIN